MMVRLHSKKWTLLVSVAVVFGSVALHAADNPVNTVFVKTELYIWNRFSDFLQVLRCGVAAGPAIGAEVAITEYAQLGAYAARERGVEFPHFLPPLWLVPYVEDEPILRHHAGVYRTTSFGPWRRENTLIEERRFRRAPADLRAQLGLGLGQVYVNVDSMAVADFFAGVVGIDLQSDDEDLDPNARRYPADQLGRGVTNVCAGIIEVPFNMMQVTKDRGDFAGATTGVAQGVWRFLVRETVGVVEVITFPMGWPAIIDPEYPFLPGRSTDWGVNTPTFMRHF